tara:strand:+ start:135 stop:725 length:591 start_codon:yes stop_codon:yes gene_type:complete
MLLLNRCIQEPGAGDGPTSVVLDNIFYLLSTLGGLCGTMIYMAPEALNVNDNTTTNTTTPMPDKKKFDVWSLGCFIIECFTGTKPFPSPQSAVYNLVVLEKAPVLPPSEVLIISEGGIHFLANCLAFNPDTRPDASTLRDSEYLLADDILNLSFLKTSASQLFKETNNLDDFEKDEDEISLFSDTFNTNTLSSDSR